MKENMNNRWNDSRRPLSLHAYYECAGMSGGPSNSGPEAEHTTVYVCKNCGRRLTLAEAASFYGIPACPVCVYAGAPFEIIREPGQTGQPGKTTDCRPVEIEQ